MGHKGPYCHIGLYCNTIGQAGAIVLCFSIFTGKFVSICDKGVEIGGNWHKVAPMLRTILRPVAKNLPIALLFGLGGCGATFPISLGPKPVEKAAVCAVGDAVCLAVRKADESTMRPKPRQTTATAAVDGALRPEDLDTTSAEELREATATTIGAAGLKLGTTIASLGNVSIEGFWLETALVEHVTPGRVVWADNGNSVAVELRPKKGEKTSGSQISLAAMRALGVPLTALPELIVFSAR